MTDPNWEVREHEVSQAAQRFTANKQRLFTETGGLVYSHEEHQRRLDALTAELSGLVDTALSGADEHLSALDREAAQLSDDPIESLDQEAIQRANSRALFVREDFDDLPLTELQPRVKAALLGQDRAAQALVARYARRRLNAEAGRVGRIPETSEAPGRYVIPPGQEGIWELETAVRELEALFSQAPKRQAIAERRSKAEAFKTRVRGIQYQADGSAEADRRAFSADFRRRF